METLEKKYCSLDIETSGFDPLTNEILEVGFAFFVVTNKGIKITEEFTQVFKPSKPVSSQILGLTGISQQELDNAPKFSEHQSFIQEKLKDAIIVGHNVVFDIKFLESFGIKFSGQFVDTLDLVQFLLPTHHSYNLENLMHTFGISHKEAHRALADSKATLKLLEKLLQVYSGFKESLKTEIKSFIKTYNFVWQELLDIKQPPIVFKDLAANGPKKESVKKTSSLFKELEPKAIYNFPLGKAYEQELALYLGLAKTKSLLVLPKARQVLDLQKQGLINQAVFLPESQFNEEKFESLLKKKNLSAEEIKFLLKILVWQRTNWQTNTLLDLNLSFFGGQFKSLVSGGKIKESKTAKLVASDQASFLQLSALGLYKDRQVIICGLSEFENCMTSDIGTKTSWGYIIYLLKSLYNPEFNFGPENFKQPVTEALLATDLFFGLVNALLQTEPSGFLYYRISAETLYDDRYQKIKSAAENYVNKLLGLNKVLGSAVIAEFGNNLADFFLEQENRVKWIELSEARCALISKPLDITGLVKEVLNPFSDKVSFVDALDGKILPKFFASRLGLQNFSFQKISTPEKKTTPAKKIKQGDLFSNIKKVLGVKQTVGCRYISKTADLKELAALLSRPSALPAALLLGSAQQVKEFYEQYYQDLKAIANVFSQTSSGGSNKIFRNFSINKKSLLVATDKFILKHLSAQNAVEPVDGLAVKTLILCHLPFEQFSHPYQQALSQALPNPFEDYVLPRALFNFHSLVKFFYTPELQNLYVIDPKLAKNYAGVFKDYYHSIPGAEIKI